jgi:hypothetical protein
MALLNHDDDDDDDDNETTIQVLPSKPRGVLRR